MNSLGTVLKDARKTKGFSLRDVEQETGISNAYLSQLETGKISKPSPEILYKISKVYGIKYSKLMSLAGYPVPESPIQHLVSRVQHRQKDSAIIEGDTRQLVDDIISLSDEEMQKVREYMDFLRSKRNDT